jgi:hypothetical protein
MEEIYLLLHIGLRREVLLREIPLREVLFLREVPLRVAFLPATRFLLSVAFFLAPTFNLAFLFLVRAAFFAAALRAARDRPMTRINFAMAYNVEVTSFCVMT